MIPRGQSRSRPASAAGRALPMFACLLLGTACVSNPAPRGILPSPDEAGRMAVGGWIEIVRSDRLGEPSLQGELLAVTDDTLYVATAGGGVAVPRSTVRDGRLFGYDPQVGSMAGAVALGTVSTISHGYFLLFTAPMWLIGGSIAARSQSRQPVRDASGHPSALRPWARFPAGLPPGFDLAGARPALGAARED